MLIKWLIKKLQVAEWRAGRASFYKASDLPHALNQLREVHYHRNMGVVAERNSGYLENVSM